MKVIKQGKNPFERKCERCGCVFVYENADIRTSGGDGDLGIPPTHFEVSCPCCKLTIEVPGLVTTTLPPREEYFDI